MPYRRLPNTNQARLRTMRVIVDKASTVVDINSLPYSLRSLEEARAMLVKYDKVVNEYLACSNIQAKANKKYQQELKMARLYVSHFIQVVNMCVLRGEIKKEYKELYKLAPDSTMVPDLSTEDKLEEWGNNVIEGEQKRQLKGGTPIYNPSIAKVKVFFEIFVESHRSQKILQANTNRKMEEVIALNEAVDKIILDAWDEIEKTFENLQGEEKVAKCQEYGIIYYYRRAEKRKMAQREAMEAEVDQIENF